MAAYSVGQLIASPILGGWADCRPTREPLIVSLIINVVFSVLYCYAGAFPQNVSLWIVLVSRALIGFGAGTVISYYVCSRRLYIIADLSRKCCNCTILCF